MKEIILYRESLIQSIISDAVSLGAMGFLLFANHRWFGDHSAVGIFLAISAFLFTCGKLAIKKRTFTSKEALLKHIETL